MFRIALLALLAAPGLAAAQHHGGGGHVGGAHVGGAHVGPHPGMAGPVHHPGGMSAPGYHGNFNNYGYRGGYSSFSTFGVPYYGGFGFPYGYSYGGIGLGYGVGGLGYGYGMGSAYGYRVVPVQSPPVLAPRTIPIDPVTSFSSPGAAVVNLVVPDGAKVWFDGKEAEVKDGKTTFTSAVLQPGQGPTLHVKARWNDRDREMYLTIRAGDKMSVDLRNQ